MTAKTKNKTELEVLETSRIAIDNAQTNLQIKELLEEVGIGGKELSEGQQIHLSAVEAYNFNKIGNNHESISYREFSTEKKALDNLYRNHRKKAKVMFKNEPRELIHLNLQNVITSYSIHYTKLYDLPFLLLEKENLNLLVLFLQFHLPEHFSFLSKKMFRQ